MKKQSVVNEEEKMYDLISVENDIARVQRLDGTKGIINLKTNEIIVPFDYFDYYNNSWCNGCFILKKSQQDASKDFFNYYTIYDFENKKLIADNWKLIVKTIINGSEALVLQNPNTLKYHYFNCYCVDKENFEKGFDSIKYIDGNIFREIFIVSRDNKKTIYSSSNGLLTELKFDDIEFCKPNILIFTENGKQTFSKGFDEYNPHSFYDELSVDAENDDLIYGKCNDDSTVTIYCSNRVDYQKLYTVTDCDNLQFACKYGLENIFYKEKDGKKGLIALEYSKNIFTNRYEKCSERNILNPEYDDIKFVNHRFILTKNNKKGLYALLNDGDRLTDLVYDEIIPKSSNHFELYKDNKCELINVRTNEIVLKDFKDLEEKNESTIYEKNGKKGLFNCTNSFRVFDGYDDVKHLGSWYFLVSKEGMKGIIKTDKIFIDPIYKDIKIHFLFAGNQSLITTSDKEFFLELKTKDDKYILAEYNSFRDEQKLCFSSKEYDRIFFLEELIFLIDENNTYVYKRMDRKLLKVLPKAINISTQIKKEDIYENLFYIIDGEYYKFISGEFVKVPTTMKKLYVTAYECENGVIVVNDYNKSIHDEKCSEIEEMKEEDIENTLLTFYNNNPKVQKKYPTLVKKLNNKKTN